MFERYSEHARAVIERARQEAQKLRHDHIGTEHLLLGLIEVKEGFAAKVLAHQNVDLVHAKKQVNSMVKHGTGPEDSNYEFLPFTVHTQNVLNDALKEARDLKHPKIGTEHILLGLLYENHGVGANVLQNMGLKLDDVRKDALHFIELDAKQEPQEA